jgi:hypothetical protein
MPAFCNNPRGVVAFTCFTIANSTRPTALTILLCHLDAFRFIINLVFCSCDNCVVSSWLALFVNQSRL